MILDVVGIWDDDTPRFEDVPENSAFALRVPAGSSVTIRVFVVDHSGIPIDLVGYALTLTVKRGVLLEDAVVKKTGVVQSPSADGVVEFTIMPADTTKFDPGRCAYDVWAVAPGGERQQVVALSPFLVGYALGP